MTRFGPHAVTLAFADSLWTSRHRARFRWLAIASGLTLSRPLLLVCCGSHACLCGLAPLLVSRPSSHLRCLSSGLTLLPSPSLMTRFGPHAVTLAFADSLWTSRHRARFCWPALGFTLPLPACFSRPRPHLCCLASALRAHARLTGSLRTPRTRYCLALRPVLALAGSS